ncbi:hypothetical protein P3T22_004049 [Paraburkholderia sp. GAS348]|jgi:hypothetical protein
MLTDMQLRALKPAKKICKVADQRGLYAAVTPSGAVSFRYDYSSFATTARWSLTGTIATIWAVTGPTCIASNATLLPGFTTPWRLRPAKGRRRRRHCSPPSAGIIPHGMMHTDGSMSARAVSFFSVEAGEITRIVEYWPESYAAPANRAHRVGDRVSPALCRLDHRRELGQFEPLVVTA